MQYLPIYINTQNIDIIVAGGGDCALAKLRILIKTQARISVFAQQVDPLLVEWANAGKIRLYRRKASLLDIEKAALIYAAHADVQLDTQLRHLAHRANVPTLIVDNLEESDFITPAIVDRTPVTVAIGTEGAAPVLARKIKSDIEEMLPQSLGVLARIGKKFRSSVLALPAGRKRRDFWKRFYFHAGPEAIKEGEWAAEHVLGSLLDEMKLQADYAGHVYFVGAGPGDPELMTLRARKLLHDADVVLYDRLVPQPIIELARREAKLIEVGKTAFGQSWQQKDINAQLIRYGKTAQVVRLKSGDSGVFGRLDEELNALDAAGIEYSITPGITAAVAAGAAIKQSLTQRNRNSSLRIITGHDTRGFAEHQWRELAAPNAVAAIYMGKTAATFMRGRLMMHGASGETPITIVENASCVEQSIISTTLLELPIALAGVIGPAVLLLGVAPRHSIHTQKKAVK